MTLRTIARTIALSLLLSIAAFSAHAQSMIAKPSHYLSAATTNSTLVFAGPVLLQWLVAVNTNGASTIFYLKLYNKGTAPVCGTDPVVLNIPLPANNTGGGLVSVGLEGAQFPNGLGFCLTANIADNDNVAAATGVTLNFGVVPQ